MDAHARDGARITENLDFVAARDEERGKAFRMTSFEQQVAEVESGSTARDSKGS